jgi:choline dehydrogenase-like flavoprotein
MNKDLQMPDTQHYDVIIIGSGAGGGTLGLKLAQAGKKVLMLERGNFLPREKENWDAEEVFLKGRYTSKDIWHDKDGKPFQPGVHYFVGGATKMYGAALFRLREKDFEQVQHHDGISPEWPVKYDTFEPYYSQAEHLFHVHGRHGEDPTDPPFSQQLKYQPVTHEPRIQRLHDQLAKAGYHPAHAPTAILLSEEHRAFSHCLKCDSCDGYPCLVHAKSDAETICVRPAMQHKNFTLVCDSHVSKLETDESGRTITRVMVKVAGKRMAATGDLVVVSCGAANTAKLLLQSASDKHPNGLANGSDQVGRNYMFHNSQAVVALSKEPNDTIFQKTLSVNDFYWGSDDFLHPIGNIQMIGKSKGPMFREDAGPLPPGFTLEMMGKHAVDFWLSTEDLPDPNNRVTLKQDGSITLSYTFNNQEPTKRLYKNLKHMLEHLDCHPHLLPNSLYLGKTIPIAGVGHQVGTCRFGTDPGTSVLNTNCQAHEVDNLYVVDSSFFPSIGAVNPSLTIIANALRVGDHIVERLG